MTAVTLEFLTERLELADLLLAGRQSMLEPQDLPGRYGRVVKAIDRVLHAAGIPAALAGGWAVWRHGFVGRITQDVDVVLPATGVDEFLRVAELAGFEALPLIPGRWPKLMHRETSVQAAILPEGERPGTASRPAPTTIRHPTEMGAAGHTLQYLTLPCLIELKLAAGRPRDKADVTELVRVNEDQVAAIRQHLTAIHPVYVEAFDRLTERAHEQQDQ